MYEDLNQKNFWYCWSIEGALLHHGEKHNHDYLMQMEQENWDSLIPKMKNLAYEKSYGKISGRVSEEAIDVFRSKVYRIEAEIHGFYNGQSTGYFLANYPNKERSHYGEQKLRILESIISIAQAADSNREDLYFDLTSKLSVLKLDLNDLIALVNLHEMAFNSYPFPIHKAEYLLELKNRAMNFIGYLNRGNYSFPPF